MSWHYLQEQEEASWEVDSLDGAPSALLNLIPTLAESSSPDSVTDALTGSRYGTTSQPLTGDNGEETSTSLAADSLVKTSRPLEKAQASKEPDRGFGWKWPGSFAKLDPVTSSWKIRQCSLFGDLEPFSGTWPRWGTMRNGECSERTMPEHLTKGIAFGSSGRWPTPKHHEERAECYTFETSYRHWVEGRQVALSQVIRDQRMWPTPTKTLWSPTKGELYAQPNGMIRLMREDGQSSRIGLEKAVTVSWPTPRCQMTRPVKVRTDVEKGHKSNLEEVVAVQAVIDQQEDAGIWPTPTAFDAIMVGKTHPTRTGTATTLAQNMDGGKLNPPWVAWLMGWPIDWTALKPLETGKFQSWLRSFGAS